MTRGGVRERGGHCGEEIAKRKVTLIQNEHIAPVFCTSWISLLDILEIIQLSEIRLFCLNKKLRASVFSSMRTFESTPLQVLQ